MKDFVCGLKDQMKSWKNAVDWDRDIPSEWEWFGMLLKIIKCLQDSKDVRKHMYSREFWCIVLVSIKYLSVFEATRVRLIGFQLWKQLPTILKLNSGERFPFAITIIALGAKRLVEIIREKEQDFCETEEGVKWVRDMLSLSKQ